MRPQPPCHRAVTGVRVAEKAPGATWACLEEGTVSWMVKFHRKVAEKVEGIFQE